MPSQSRPSSPVPLDDIGDRNASTVTDSDDDIDDDEEAKMAMNSFQRRIRGRRGATNPDSILPAPPTVDESGGNRDDADELGSEFDDAIEWEDSDEVESGSSDDEESGSSDEVEWGSSDDDGWDSQADESWLEARRVQVEQHPQGAAVPGATVEKAQTGGVSVEALTDHPLLKERDDE